MNLMIKSIYVIIATLSTALIADTTEGTLQFSSDFLDMMTTSSLIESTINWPTPIVYSNHHQEEIPSPNTTHALKKLGFFINRAWIIYFLYRVGYWYRTNPDMHNAGLLSSVTDIPTRFINNSMLITDIIVKSWILKMCGNVIHDSINLIVD